MLALLACKGKGLYGSEHAAVWWQDGKQEATAPELIHARQPSGLVETGLLLPIFPVPSRSRICLSFELLRSRLVYPNPHQKCNTRAAVLSRPEHLIASMAHLHKTCTSSSSVPGLPA